MLCACHAPAVTGASERGLSSLSPTPLTGQQIKLLNEASPGMRGGEFTYVEVSCSANMGSSHGYFSSTLQLPKGERLSPDPEPLTASLPGKQRKGNDWAFCLKHSLSTWSGGLVSLGGGGLQFLVCRKSNGHLHCISLHAF